ncbi:MAG: hypothetical protein M1816_006880 [Peltula sp. TS41687]|nr:MAG: hypothetical protein M1816_006880 [Peltula sp. TS41687]
MSTPTINKINYTVRLGDHVAPEQATEIIKAFDEKCHGQGAMCTYLGSNYAILLECNTRNEDQCLSTLTGLINEHGARQIAYFGSDSEGDSENDNDDRMDASKMTWEQVYQSDSDDDQNIIKASEGIVEKWQPKNPKTDLVSLFKRDDKDLSDEIAKMTDTNLHMSVQRRQVLIEAEKDEVVMKVKEMLNVLERQFHMLEQSVVTYTLEVEPAPETQLRFLALNDVRNKVMQSSMIELKIRYGDDFFVLRVVRQEQLPELDWMQTSARYLAPFLRVPDRETQSLSKLWTGFEYAGKGDRSLIPGRKGKGIAPLSVNGNGSENKDQDPKAIQPLAKDGLQDGKHVVSSALPSTSGIHPNKSVKSVPGAESRAKPPIATPAEAVGRNIRKARRPIVLGAQQGNTLVTSKPVSKNVKLQSKPEGSSGKVSKPEPKSKPENGTPKSGEKSGYIPPHMRWQTEKPADVPPQPREQKETSIWIPPHLRADPDYVPPHIRAIQEGQLLGVFDKKDDDLLITLRPERPQQASLNTVQEEKNTSGPANRPIVAPKPAKNPKPLPPHLRAIEQGRLLGIIKDTESPVLVPELADDDLLITLPTERSQKASLGTVHEEEDTSGPANLPIVTRKPAKDPKPLPPHLRAIEQGRLLGIIKDTESPVPVPEPADDDLLITLPTERSQHASLATVHEEENKYRPADLPIVTPKPAKAPKPLPPHLRAIEQGRLLGIIKDTESSVPVPELADDDLLITLPTERSQQENKSRPADLPIVTPKPAKDPKPLPPHLRAIEEGRLLGIIKDTESPVPVPELADDDLLITLPTERSQQASLDTVHEEENKSRPADLPIPTAKPAETPKPLPPHLRAIEVGRLLGVFRNKNSPIPLPGPAEDKDLLTTFPNVRSQQASSLDMVQKEEHLPEPVNLPITASELAESSKPATTGPTQNTHGIPSSNMDQENENMPGTATLSVPTSDLVVDTNPAILEPADQDFSIELYQEDENLPSLTAKDVDEAQVESEPSLVASSDLEQEPGKDTKESPISESTGMKLVQELTEIPEWAYEQLQSSSELELAVSEALDQIYNVDLMGSPPNSTQKVEEIPDIMGDLIQGWADPQKSADVSKGVRSPLMQTSDEEAGEVMTPDVFELEEGPRAPTQDETHTPKGTSNDPEEVFQESKHPFEVAKLALTVYAEKVHDQIAMNEMRRSGEASKASEGDEEHAKSEETTKALEPEQMNEEVPRAIDDIKDSNEALEQTTLVDTEGAEKSNAVLEALEQQGIEDSKEVLDVNASNETQISGEAFKASDGEQEVDEPEEVRETLEKEDIKDSDELIILGDTPTSDKFSKASKGDEKLNKPEEVLESPKHEQIYNEAFPKSEEKDANMSQEILDLLMEELKDFEVEKLIESVEAPEALEQKEIKDSKEALEPALLDDAQIFDQAAKQPKEEKEADMSKEVLELADSKERTTVPHHALIIATSEEERYKNVEKVAEVLGQGQAQSTNETAESSIQERLQISDEVESREYKRTMDQRKSIEEGETPKKKTSNVHKMHGSVLEMLELAKTHRGKVEIRMELGKILVSGLNTAQKPFPPEEWDNFFVEQSSLSVEFTKLLTTSATDADSILDMKTVDGRRYFKALPEAKQVFYEIECSDSSGEELTVHVDGTSFEFEKIRKPSRMFGSVYSFYPERSWDSRVVVEGINTTSQIEDEVKELVDNLFIPPNQTNISLSTNAPDLRIRSVILKRRSRHLVLPYRPQRRQRGQSTTTTKTSSTSSSASTTSNSTSSSTQAHPQMILQITEARDLILQHHPSIKGALRAFSTPALQMINDVEGSRLWYEVDLIPLASEQLLKENVALGLAEEASWTADMVVGEKLMGRLYGLTKDMLEGMDDVGRVLKKRMGVQEKELMEREKQRETQARLEEEGKLIDVEDESETVGKKMDFW